MNDILYVRVGGGFMTYDAFYDKYAETELRQQKREEKRNEEDKLRFSLEKGGSPPKKKKKGKKKKKPTGKGSEQLDVDGVDSDGGGEEMIGSF